MSTSINNALDLPTSVQGEMPSGLPGELGPDAPTADRRPVQALDQASQMQAPSTDWIEVSAHQWWETNAALIFEGPGTAADKAEALQQLGPAPETADRILIDREGNITGPDLSRSEIAPAPDPSSDRGDRSGHPQAPQAGMASDVSAAQIEQRDLLLKAAEQIQERAGVLREQLDQTDLDSYATRLELSKQIGQLESFTAQMRAAASTPSQTVDLSRTEIDYGPDPEAEFSDIQSGLDHVPYLQAAEREHEIGLARIAPIVAHLQRAGIEVHTDFVLVDPPDRELEQDEGLEL